MAVHHPPGGRRSSGLTQPLREVVIMPSAGCPPALRPDRRRKSGSQFATARARNSFGQSGGQTPALKMFLRDQPTVQFIDFDAMVRG